ncbi:MAG: phosphoglycerate kinase [Acidobacteriaceae bacterium]
MIKVVTTVKFKNAAVLLRAGFDVPLKQLKEKNEWVVADNTRIKDCLPTIQYLIGQRAKIILLSHLDRPKGQVVSDKSMWPVAFELAGLLGLKPVRVKDVLPAYSIPHLYFLDSDITKKDYSPLVSKMKPGDILFLENLRFYPGEEEGDRQFIETLAKFGKFYVNEAFSVAHRKEASMFGLPSKLTAYVGISFAKEIAALDRLIKNPAQPFVVIMGGVKVEDKVDTINYLGDKAQKLLLGGAIGNGFIKALGYEIGQSKAADESVAKQIYRNFKDKIVLPEDVVVAKTETDNPRVVTLDKVLPNETIFDIGPKTVARFSGEISKAKTVVWNGPLGKIEVSKFAFGSKAMARAIAGVGKGKAFTVVGGGETALAVDMTHVSEFIDHISTGGGALLEYLAGKKLPAIKALEQ